jgi:hypothetical protein
MGLAALLAIDVAVVVLVDVVITLMGKGAPHLWLPGGLATLSIDRYTITLEDQYCLWVWPTVKGSSVDSGRYLGA